MGYKCTRMVVKRVKIVSLRYPLPARRKQQPAAVGHLWVQEAVWSKACQSHRGGLGQPAQCVATETALPVACSAALLHCVPRCKDELQPALQPHRPLRPEPRRPLGVLSASQEGAVGHLATRYRHARVFFVLFYFCDNYAFCPPEGSWGLFCFSAAGNQREVAVILMPSHFFPCQVASAKIRCIWTGSSGCFGIARPWTSRCWRL